ncbi:TonB-dependent receptor [Granulicella mallensis]|uniref:TonB-dependent receptor n=1 Tax=Granulicella mallensis TaxID=940614 RepID=UPI0002D25989|nr:TonB-dependent receptor [Granulicella mallensis]
MSTLVVLFGMLFMAAPQATAQSTFGSIRGLALDNTGAAVPDTQITLHDIDKNTDRVAKTDNTGSYTLENVLAGRYTIRGQHEGFAETTVNGITIAARQDLRITLTMPVATQVTEVQVTTSANHINTENGIIGDSKGTAEIGQLPLNFRASTTSPLASLETSPNVQQDSSGNVAIGGATANQIGFSVDGISTANIFNSAAGTNPYPSPEGIGELKVTAFNNNAEFSQVADVTFTSKGGTNNFHGNVFEYLQNDALDARVLNFTEKAPKHFNTFGGSIGGPVIIPHLYNGHDKTFFFFDYEGNRRRTSQAEQYTVPDALERAGNLSEFGQVLNNPATGQPYPANTNIPVSPFASALLNQYYPLPNAPNGNGFNYQTLVPIPSNTDGFDARIDQVLTSKQQVYARFNRKNLTVNTVNPLLPNDVDTEHDRSFLVSHNYIISSQLLNEFRYGFTDTILSPNFPIEGAAAIQGLNIQVNGNQGVNVSNHPTDQGFPTIVFSDGTGFTPIGRDHVGPTQSTTKQLADNLTYSRGRHTMRAGVDIRWVRFAVPEIETPSDDYGLFTFNQGAFTGNAFGDLLLGAPNTTYFAVTGPRDDAGGMQTGVYAQDQWQASDRLTISYGLRWELLPPFVDKNGIQANFDPNYAGVGANGQGAIIVNNVLLNGLGPAPAFLASFNACGLGGVNPNYNAATCTPVVTNQQDGLATGLRQTYFKNFDPRISLAYRPFSDDKTVIRAGFGIFTVTALGQLQNNNESNPQAVVNTWQNNPTGTNGKPTGMPIFTFPHVTPPNAGLQFGGGELEQATDPHYRDAQSEQWNLTVEREVTSYTSVRVSYVGMNSYRLPVTVNLNQTKPSATPYNFANAPFQNWGVIFSTENLGFQDYQALELEASHKTSRGLSYQANYTWAHNVSDGQGDAPTTFQGETRYGLADLNRFDISANNGNVVGTRRQRLLVSGTYELPFGKGRQWLADSRALSTIFGGWNVNTITLLETGPYLTPTDSVNHDQTNTDPSGDGSIVRPDRVGNPRQMGVIAANPSCTPTPGTLFNLCAFAPTPVGAARIGNAGVGSLEGPGTIAVSAGLAKVFEIRNNLHLRFESTFTNILNHTNFAPPVTNISEPLQFGVLNAQQTAENAGNRTGQVALRLEF